MGLHEEVVQRFDPRCPYCDHPVRYGHLQPGEHPVQCPSCHRTYIKVVFDSLKDRRSTKPTLRRKKTSQRKKGRR